MREERLTVRDIVDLIETAIPVSLQEEWDNSGLLVGFEDVKVERILTCLEITDDVIDDALSKGIDLIVTHHPIIFGSVRHIRNKDIVGANIMKLIQNGISVYSSHTPFDKVSGGNNDALAGLLGLKKVTDLAGGSIPSPDKMLEHPSEMHIGRIGELKKAMPFSQVIDLVCNELKLSRRKLHAVGTMDTNIRKIGICTGAGAEYARQAEAQGCQLFITGDLKYHQAQEAKSLGICVLDAGHYGTEKIFSAVMKVQLEKIIGDESIEIEASDIDIDPFTEL